MIASVASAALEEAINRYLELDPDAKTKIAQLHGRVVGIELAGIGTIYLVPGPEGIQMTGHHEGEPDCVLKGSPLDLMRMTRSEDSAKHLFAGRVTVEGDSELGHRFGKILASVDIDWEEQLSRITGDVVAHEMGKGARAVANWGKATADTASKNLQEYLQEEIRLLPTRYEVEEFLAEVDTLRDDVERLQTRVERMRGRLRR